MSPAVPVRYAHAVDGVLVPCGLSGRPVVPCPHCPTVPPLLAGVIPGTHRPRTNNEIRTEGRAVDCPRCGVPAGVDCPGAALPHMARLAVVRGQPVTAAMLVNGRKPAGVR